MAKKVTKKVIKTELSVPAPTVTVPTTPSRLNPKILTSGLIILTISLLIYKFGPWLVPALVNNKPITRFALWSRLEQSYGTQVLDDLVNEAILDRAIAQSGIKVESAKITEQMTKLEDQFKEMGGLDAALAERGLTRADLTRQVTTQLSVEELLSDKINPSEEEIEKEFETNASTLYKDKKFDDVKEDITTQLRDAKLRDEFLAWFAEVKKTISVKSFGL